MLPYGVEGEMDASLEVKRELHVALGLKKLNILLDLQVL